MQGCTWFDATLIKKRQGLVKCIVCVACLTCLFISHVEVPPSHNDLYVIVNAHAVVTGDYARYKKKVKQEVDHSLS